MKKLALLLAIILSIACAEGAAFAQPAEFFYSADEIEELYYDFEFLSGMIDYMFCSDEAIGYWKYANGVEAKKVEQWLIDTSARIIGEEPDEKYYTEMLIKMITLFEYSAAQQVESQSRVDKLKSFEDHAFDLIDIGASVVGLDGAAKDIAKGFKVLSAGIDLTKATIEELEYYELSIRNYAQAELFLKAVSEYSDNELLSSAAAELRKPNRLLFKERVRLISSTAKNVGKFSKDTFLAELSFSILKNRTEYKTDSSVKDYVDFGEKAYGFIDDLISIGQLTFKVMMLGADGNFGTNATFRRHNEMMAMADIAQALVKAGEAVTISEHASAQTVYSNINIKCEYYRMLLSVHIRGEYLMYSLLSEDAELLSDFSNWTEKYFKGKNGTVKEWYDEQIGYFEKYCGQIEKIFERLDSIKPVVHGGFELHDGFISAIKRKDTVPDGYIGVYTFEDFKKIADSCPSTAPISSSFYNPQTEFNTANYILMNDITFPAEYDSAGVFFGILDGNGYTMHNLSKPLFITVSNATIKNLGMEIDFVIDTNDGEYSFGTIACGQHVWTNGEGIVVDNCFVKGNIDITCRSGQFGGLIGYGEGVSIKNCYNEADISVKTRQSSKTGGICGESAFISNCYNTGNINSYASCALTMNEYSINVFTGGIQGYNYGDSIKNCYNIGEIKTKADGECSVSSGGIIGYNYGWDYYSNYISNCYNIGTVSCDWTEDYDSTLIYGQTFGASYSSGGIVGWTGENLILDKCWNGGDISGEHFIGGIVGRAYLQYEDSITDCYNTGWISAVQYAGGIVGADTYATGIQRSFNVGMISDAQYCGALAGTLKNGQEKLSACYYLDNGVSATGAGINYSGAQKLTAEQMTDTASFKEFDFLDVWVIKEGSTHPELRW